jgi:hypothetical protein
MKTINKKFFVSMAIAFSMLGSVGISISNAGVIRDLIVIGIVEDAIKNQNKQSTPPTYYPGTAPIVKTEKQNVVISDDFYKERISNIMNSQVSMINTEEGVVFISFRDKFVIKKNKSRSADYYYYYPYPITFPVVGDGQFNSKIRNADMEDVIPLFKDPSMVKRLLEDNGYKIVEY